MASVARVFAAVLVAAAALAPSPARAATTGAIEGTVVDQATGKKLGGVTVTVTSPALQGEQTEFTDGDGHYIITELPPGEYLVRFYFADINVERPGVIVQADKTLSANIAFPTQKAAVKTYRITEKAPTVDVGNTQQQTAVTNELVRNTPVQGRTYDAIMSLAPGAAAGTGEAGIGKGASVSFNGATGPENNFLIDGVNSTNPAFGLVGTQLTLEFIGETELITGGYNAEYGRATGGVVNVITKSGSNSFHGDLWLYATPFQLEAPLVARVGEAIGGRTHEKYAMDFGFDLGGPIVKDKVWFYAGFAPTFTTFETARSLRTRLDNDIPAGFAGAYKGDLDTNVTCPPWLDKRFCTTPGYATQNLGDSYTRRYQSDTRLYNWIAKLNFQLNQNNSLVLQYIGSPQSFDGVLGSLNGSDGQLLGSTFDNTHDALIHFVSKLADRKLQLDVIAGYHYEDATTTPSAAGAGPGVLYSVTEPLSTFEPGVTPCAPQTPSAGVSFNPCPVLNYVDGGFGFLAHTTSQRISASAAATYFARLGGTHAIKVGFDFEDDIYRDVRGYSGGTFYRVRAGGPEIYRQYATKIPGNGPNGAGMVLLDGFDATTTTFNYGAYLRDSYNVGFVPGLTVNAGVRWEGQQVRDVNGETQIGIFDNWAPRVGAVYDFTRKGRSEAVRQLRPLLRVDPARHQRPAVLGRRHRRRRRRGPATPTPPGASTRPPARVRRSPTRRSTAAASAWSRRRSRACSRRRSPPACSSTSASTSCSAPPTSIATSAASSRTSHPTAATTTSWPTPATPSIRARCTTSRARSRSCRPTRRRATATRGRCARAPTPSSSSRCTRI